MRLLNDNKKLPATYTTILPMYFGLAEVGFPSSCMLIGVHLRVLHSNPNLPFFPADVGIIGIKQISHAKTTTPTDSLRNLSVASSRGKKIPIDLQMFYTKKI